MPDKSYPEGVTKMDHVNHDMKMGRFPNQSSVETFLKERETLAAQEKVGHLPNGSSERDGGGNLAALSAKATLGPWYVESEKSDGTYGSIEDAGEGYDVSTICTEAERPYGMPGVLFESQNSTVALIEEEHNEDTTRAWDTVSKANAEFIVALVNAYRSGKLKEATDA